MAASFSSSGISRHIFTEPTYEQTPDEITLLKMELQSLIQEKASLKSKIDYVSNPSKHPKERHIRNPAFISSELERTEHYITQRRNEIDSLSNSDIANLVRERQRESLILYQETRRHQELKLQRESELSDITRKYDQMARQYSPDSLDDTNVQLETLEKELELQTRRVERATGRLLKREEALGTSVSRLSDRGRSALYERIRSLKSRIKQEEAELRLICSDIARLKNDR